MASLPWTQYVNNAFLAPTQQSGVESVLLIGKDGAMWGLVGSLVVSAHEAVALAQLVNGLKANSNGSCDPISPTLGGAKFMGMRADTSEFVCNGPNKSCIVGIICPNTIILAKGNLDQARNISASFGKVVAEVSESLAGTM